MRTKQLTIDAMLAALCAVLGYLAIDLGVIKITFESLPILVGALLFGPFDGLAVGAIGTLIYQLLRYGVSVTTLLWILPYVAAGLLVGLYAKIKKFKIGRAETIILVVIAEVLITLLNTLALYVDSHVYYYYTETLITAYLGVRFLLAVVKGAVFGAVLPVLIKSIRGIVRPENQ